jgi:uncharacterized protein (TIGR00369 family)
MKRLMIQGNSDKIIERPPFVKLLGLQVLSIGENSATMSLPFKDDLVGNLRLPALHGGVTAAFIDHCSGLCAWSTLRDPHQTLSTVDIRVDYLSPASVPPFFDTPS